jgi:hypothetical protein
MTERAVRRALVLVLFVGCIVLYDPADAAAKDCATPIAADCSNAAPVGSLEPRATELEWRRLVGRPAMRTFGMTADCRPLRGIFYTASDWLRLATRLAASASPCAQYYISIPPFAGDKTRLRGGQASRIRALGPSFHALAEIHFATWQKWVASTGSSFYQAGVEARRRMAATGYDVSAGDTWALNELSSAVRRGDGTARADARELIRGLYDAGGELPAARGVVFVVGVGQTTPDLATYKARSQEWLQDSAFWTDLSAWVSDWSQEVYADVRSYAAPGAPPAGRRDALVDYLQHQSLLAGAGGDASGAARSFLAAAASPLASAAWQWESSYGWTLVSHDLMRHFVSAQIHALRHHSATSGQASDHWGFAWAPRNSAALEPAEFTRQTGEVLDRIAGAIRDSAVNGPPGDPGAGACGSSGQNLWCTAELPGAAITDRWGTFRSWSQPALAFVSAPQSVVAGGVSGPISVQLQIAGVASRALAPLTMTLTSSSPTGGFATSPSGPFTPTIALTLTPGAVGAPPVYFQDTRTGTVAVTASAPGFTTASQGLTVTGAALAALRIDPASAALVLGASRVFTAVGVDSFGNPVPVASAVWTLAPGTPGTVEPASGPTTTYSAGTGAAGSGEVLATVTTPFGPISASAPVTVTAPPSARVAAVRYGVAKRRLYVYVTVVNARGLRLRGASVTVALYRNGKLYARAAGRTESNGRMTFARPASWGAYRAKVTRVVANGYAWNKRTPGNTFRRPKPPRID